MKYQQRSWTPVICSFCNNYDFELITNHSATSSEKDSESIGTLGVEATVLKCRNCGENEYVFSKVRPTIGM